MNAQIKEKLALLEVFCKEHKITLESFYDADGSSHIDLKIHNEKGELIDYDNIGHTVTYL